MNCAALTLAAFLAIPGEGCLMELWPDWDGGRPSAVGGQVYRDGTPVVFTGTIR